MDTKDKLISLKEASELSGYSSDYVGQLIRKGKIFGKQVYFNVAWMTTKEAVLEYLQKSGGEGRSVPGTVGALVQGTRGDLLRYVQSTNPLRLILYVTIGLVIVFTLILFYILSVIVDRTLNDEALRRAQNSHLTQ